MAQEKEEDPLQLALSSAFTEPINLPSTISLPDSPVATAPAAIPIPTTLPPAGAESAPAPRPKSGSDESWKTEYEAQVSQWHAESARLRQKAEETRAKYEAIRAQEEAEAKEKEKRASQQSLKESATWENVDHPTASPTAEQGRVPLPKTLGTPGRERVSPADVRDLVAGETPSATNKSSPTISLSQPSTDPEDDPTHSRWEDIPSSLESSLPSLPSNPSPPQAGGPGTGRVAAQQSTQTQVPAGKRSGHQPQDSKDGRPSATEGPTTQTQPPAVTPLIFSSSVPARTRALALLSSLAINMFLPFVNGVMLGFGEIFARNVIGPWIGWKSIINPNGTPTLERTRLSADTKSSSRRDELRRRSPNL